MNTQFISERCKAALILLLSLACFNACKKETQTASAPIRPVTPQSNAYVTKLFEFNPAPGQFINTSLGDSTAAAGILGGTQGLVSLGAYGGYIVLGFDHTVLDIPGKQDLIVYGNAFPGFAEPGVVWVMQDENGNGKPDDTWYELAGSEFGKPGYVRNYAVTYTRPTPASGNVPWKDNIGDSGFVLTNMFHTQNYYPDNKGNTYTLTGTLLPSTNVDTTNPTYILSYPFAYGYCDNTGGGDSLNISNAIDKYGKKVALTGIDFIKVQTGIQINMGWLGELSTEVTGAADLSILK